MFNFFAFFAQSIDQSIAFYNSEPGKKNFVIPLTERSFKTLDGNDIQRADLMMVLANLNALHIRASPELGVASISISNVIMQATDYNLPRGSGEVILGVEECVCPEGKDLA